MNYLFKLATVAVLFVTAGACSPTLSPFTSTLYEQNRWSDDDLKRIQFYTSDDIVLRRKITEGSSKIVSGEIKMVNGEEIEEIIIKRNTPGVFLFRKGDQKMAVSFEGGREQRYLLFGPNPNKRGAYVLLASDWDNRRGKIEYDNKVFYAIQESALASLLVDLKKVTHTARKSRTAKGRTIN